MITFQVVVFTYTFGWSCKARCVHSGRCCPCLANDQLLSWRTLEDTQRTRWDSSELQEMDVTLQCCLVCTHSWMKCWFLCSISHLHFRFSKQWHFIIRPNGSHLTDYINHQHRPSHGIRKHTLAEGRCAGNKRNCLSTRTALQTEVRCGLVPSYGSRVGSKCNIKKEKKRISRNRLPLRLLLHANNIK